MIDFAGLVSYQMNGFLHRVVRLVVLGHEAHEVVCVQVAVIAHHVEPPRIRMGQVHFLCVQTKVSGQRVLQMAYNPICLPSP